MIHAFFTNPSSTTINPRSIDFYEKVPKLPKIIPAARNFAEKAPQIHDDQPMAPAF